jgi:holo-[acyl-carrier protein] synthase
MIPAPQAAVDRRADADHRRGELMIAGLGLDLVEIARVERTLARHADAFMRRVLTPTEREFAATRRGLGLATHVAGRFAAKEAVFKALGTGLAAGSTWHDVEVVATAIHTAPRLVLHGAALERSRALGVRGLHLSITHTDATAAAVVVIER